MAKVTKRAKKVNIICRKVVGIVQSYTCPSCRTTYTGVISDNNIVRFMCECGQLLEVYAYINEG